MRVRLILYVLALLMGTLSFYSLQEFKTASSQSDQMKHIIGSSRDLMISALDAETGQRGYIITQTQAFLAPYTSGMADLQKNIRELGLASYGTSQVHLLGDIAQAVQAKSDEMETAIKLRATQGFAAAAEEVSNGQGKDYMDVIRTDLDTLIGWAFAQLNHTTEIGIFYARLSFFCAVGGMLAGISGFFFKRHKTVIILGEKGDTGPTGADGPPGTPGLQGLPGVPGVALFVPPGTAVIVPDPAKPNGGGKQ